MRTPALWISAPLLGVLAVLVGAPAFAAGPPLSAYTIYGENGVTIGFESDIVGLVGGRNNDPVAGNTAVRLNGGAIVDGDVRSGGNVNLQNNAVITGTLYRPAGTTLTLNNGSSIGTSLFPVDPMLPVFPPATPITCPTGGAAMSGGNGQSLTLTPGSYGALSYGGLFDLTLDGAGNYYFDSINAGNGSTLKITQPGTKVFVCGQAHWGGLKMTTPTSSPCDFYIEVQASGLDAFQVGGNSDIIGDVFAPNGEIHIGAGSSQASFIGRQFANMIDIEHSVSGSAIDCQGPPPGNMNEFRTNKDATILHTRKNENDGATLTLRVQNQTRSLVAFDVSLIAADLPNTKSAKLILTVSDNGFDVPPFSPSSGWPANGGLTYVARLDDGFEDWVEGNGNNYPTPKNPRGTGSGVTWNCETDTNIANEKPDCGKGILYWRTGGKKYQGPLRGPALHTDNMADGTKVEFDVTPDVLAGLGPQDNMFITWFILVKGPGSVAYYSREGAAAAGHPEYAPTLVIQQ
jgi:hypothetical protein